MTTDGFFLRVVRKLPILTRMGSVWLKKKIATVRSRRKLNTWFNRINLDSKAVFQNTFSKIFRDDNSSIEPGTWINVFRGKEIKMPLRNEFKWLDWDNAISILAHDPEVKKTYENLLNEEFGIRTFFDVGANYGTHSLLFLSQGIKTVSFEPIHTLNDHFRLLCETNNLTGNMVNSAAGDKNTVTRLSFPPEASWLGTIVEKDASRLRESMDLQTIEVPVIKLDDYVRTNEVYPDLIKIDTEGNEIKVLEGAVDLVTSKAPLIIFESNTAATRKELWDYFKRVSYEVCTLPYGRNTRHVIESASDFERNLEFNFMAAPVEPTTGKEK